MGLSIYLGSVPSVKAQPQFQAVANECSGLVGGILIDDSTSMYQDVINTETQGQGNDNKFVRYQGAKLYIDLATSDECLFGLRYGATTHQIKPRTKLNTEQKRADFSGGFNEADKTRLASTKTGQVLKEARENYLTFPAEAVQPTQKFVILLTDGQPDGDQATLIQTEKEAYKQAHIAIFVILLGSNVNEDFARDLASSTGGGYYWTRQLAAESKLTVGPEGEARFLVNAYIKIFELLHPAYYLTQLKMNRATDVATNHFKINAEQEVSELTVIASSNDKTTPTAIMPVLSKSGNNYAAQSFANRTDQANFAVLRIQELPVAGDFDLQANSLADVFLLARTPLQARLVLPGTQSLDQMNQPDCRIGGQPATRLGGSSPYFIAFQIVKATGDNCVITNNKKVGLYVQGQPVQVNDFGASLNKSLLWARIAAVNGSVPTEISLEIAPVEIQETAGLSALHLARTFRLEPGTVSAKLALEPGAVTTDQKPLIAFKAPGENQKGKGSAVAYLLSPNGSEILDEFRLSYNAQLDRYEGTGQKSLAGAGTYPYNILYVSSSDPATQERGAAFTTEGRLKITPGIDINSDPPSGSEIELGEKGEPFKITYIFKGSFMESLPTSIDKPVLISPDMSGDDITFDWSKVSAPTGEVRYVASFSFSKPFIDKFLNNSEVQLYHFTLKFSLPNMALNQFEFSYTLKKQPASIRVTLDNSANAWSEPSQLYRFDWPVISYIPLLFDLEQSQSLTVTGQSFNSPEPPDLQFKLDNLKFNGQPSDNPANLRVFEKKCQPAAANTVCKVTQYRLEFSVSGSTSDGSYTATLVITDTKNRRIETGQLTQLTYQVLPSGRTFIERNWQRTFLFFLPFIIGLLIFFIVSRRIIRGPVFKGKNSLWVGGIDYTDYAKNQKIGYVLWRKKPSPIGGPRAETDVVFEEPAKAKRPDLIAKIAASSANTITVLPCRDNVYITKINSDVLLGTVVLDRENTSCAIRILGEAKPVTVEFIKQNDQDASNRPTNRNEPDEPALAQGQVAPPADVFVNGPDLFDDNMLFRGENYTPPDITTGYSSGETYSSQYNLFSGSGENLLSEDYTTIRVIDSTASYDKKEGTSNQSRFDLGIDALN